MSDTKEFMDKMKAKVWTHMQQEMLEALSHLTGYFTDRAGTWIDCDELLFPILRLKPNDCERCKGPVRMAFYMPTMEELAVYKKGDLRVRITCTACHQSWIENETLQ